MGANLLVAFAFMLVIEGIMPFIAPDAWRNMFKKMIQMSDGQIRFIGLASMGGGLLLLLFSN